MKFILGNWPGSSHRALNVSRVRAYRVTKNGMSPLLILLSRPISAQSTVQKRSPTLRHCSGMGNCRLLSKKTLAEREAGEIPCPVARDMDFFLLHWICAFDLQPRERSFVSTKPGSNIPRHNKSVLNTLSVSIKFVGADGHPVSSELRNIDG